MSLEHPTPREGWLSVLFFSLIALSAGCANEPPCGPEDVVEYGYTTRGGETTYFPAVCRDGRSWVPTKAQYEALAEFDRLTEEAKHDQ